MHKTDPPMTAALMTHLGMTFGSNDTIIDLTGAGALGHEPGAAA